MLIYNTRVAPQCSPHPPDTIYLKILILSSYFCFDSTDVSSSCCIFSPQYYTQICPKNFPVEYMELLHRIRTVFFKLQYVLGSVSFPLCVCVKIWKDM